MPIFNYVIGVISDSVMPLIALIIYLLLRKKISRYEQPIFIYILVNLLLFSSTNILGYYKINNLFLYHFFSLFEFIVIIWYIIVALLGKNRSLFFWVTAAYLFFWTVNILFWEPLAVFNSNSSGMANILMLLLSMYYMIQLSKADDILNFQKLPSFWIVSAFLISSAISVMGVVVYKYYQFNLSSEEMDTGLNIWLLPLAGNIIKFILIIFGLICYKRRHSNSTSRYLFP